MEGGERELVLDPLEEHRGELASYHQLRELEVWQEVDQLALQEQQQVLEEEA